MDCEDGFFPITSVHRLDIREALQLSDEQRAKITDDMVRDIARKMADSYCEQLFWDHLPIIAEYVAEREGIDLKKETLDEEKALPVSKTQNTEVNENEYL